MPIKMNARYDVDELESISQQHLRLTLLKGFQVLRIPAREKYKGVNSFGHLLFPISGRSAVATSNS